MVSYKIETYGKMFTIIFKKPRADKFHSCLLDLGLKNLGYRLKYGGRIEKKDEVEQFIAGWRQPKRKPVTKPRIDSLCVSCEKCDGRCLWSRKPIFRPVPGWVAEPTVIRCGKYNGVMRLQRSYLVLSCPEYERINMVGRRA